MVATASTGYLPAADSADSITASAPSKMAVATSDTSARVGTGLLIIDSSICVATTTGLPARRAARVIDFWMPGTRSSGISTPRSPRATISASVMSRISSSRVTACGFSILAITAARPRVIFLASAMSSGRWMKESAIQSTSASSAASRSERSFCASAENGIVVSGRLTPLRSDRLPPTSTRVTILPSATSVAVRRILPSSSSSAWPGSIASKISGCGRCTRAVLPGALSRVERERGALRQRHRAAFELPDAQLRALQIDQDADRPLAFLLDRADGRHQLAHAVMRRVAHIDAEDVGAGAEQRRDHGTFGRRRAERGDDLGTAQTSHQ